MAMSKLAKGQLKFVDPPTDEFNCPICLGILQEPYLTACCGNHFCKECIEKVKEGTNKCPLCQETPLKLTNTSLRRKLNKLKVYCIHQENGCKWIGGLGKLERHLAIGEIKGECQYVMVKCTISDLCNSQILRTDFTHHIKNTCKHRLFECQHCGCQSTYLVITTEHYDQCPDYPMLCPNNCSKQTYPRGQLVTHLASCPEQKVDCTFSEMGCKEKVKRWQLQQHLETNLLQHQMIMCTTIKQLQIDKQELQKQVNILNKELAMAVKESNWPLYLDKMRQIASCNPEAPILFEIPFMITNTVSCVPDNLHGGTYCSAPAYHSSLFYSHPNGYKLQLVAKFISHCSWCMGESLNIRFLCLPLTVVSTDGKICSISVDFYIMNGEYDDNLKWPFSGQIAVSLLNDRLHHKKEKHYKGECKSNKASQLIVKQDTNANVTNIDKLKAEFQNLLLEAEKAKEGELKCRLQNIYENLHLLNNPNSLLFPIDGGDYTLDGLKLYFEVTYKH